MFWRIKSNQDIEASVPQTNNNDWFDLLTIKDILPRKRLIVYLTNVLIGKDITTKQAGYNCLDKDFVIISNLSGN